MSAPQRLGSGGDIAQTTGEVAGGDAHIHRQNNTEHAEAREGEKKQKQVRPASVSLKERRV